MRDLEHRKENKKCKYWLKLEKRGSIGLASILNKMKSDYENKPWKENRKKETNKIDS